MIKCNKCLNNKKFNEIHIGGIRKHEWEQSENGRIFFCGSNFDKVDDTNFECAKCGNNMNEQYRKFLQALFEIYNEDKHGA